MSEIINAIFALAVLVFLFRWLTGGADDPATAKLGFRPKSITDDMIDRVADAFPHIPRDNIRYDLLRTGDVAVTTEKILSRGFLDAPPSGYYDLYPRSTSSDASQATTPASDKGKGKAVPSETLISRFHLEERLQSAEESVPPAPEAAGGKAAWEATPEKREASLRERKAQMILAARQRMLAQQQAQQSASASAST